MKEIPDELVIQQSRMEKASGGFSNRSGEWDGGFGAKRSIPDPGYGYTASGIAASNMKAGAGKASGTDFKVGDQVVHKKFGVGKISAVILDKGDQVLEIDFRNAGMKRLMAAFANLVKL